MLHVVLLNVIHDGALKSKFLLPNLGLEPFCHDFCQVYLNMGLEVALKFLGLLVLMELCGEFGSMFFLQLSRSFEELIVLLTTHV